jgi:cob(I)alamin adenosyltransferase
LTKIYTRTGDDGTTGLIGGRRVSKDDLRIEAYGCVDELNSILGLALCQTMPSGVSDLLRRVQDDLFTVGAQLATPGGAADSARPGFAALTAGAVAFLEKGIDRFEAELPPLRQFILPGGTMPAAWLHLARTVARRTERSCVSLSHADTVAPEVLSYINRLSDLLFVLSRFVNMKSGVAEIHPTFGRQS